MFDICCVTWFHLNINFLLYDVHLFITFCILSIQLCSSSFHHIYWLQYTLLILCSTVIFTVRLYQRNYPRNRPRVKGNGHSHLGSRLRKQKTSAGFKSYEVSITIANCCSGKEATNHTFASIMTSYKPNFC